MKRKLYIEEFLFRVEWLSLSMILKKFFKFPKSELINGGFYPRHEMAVVKYLNLNFKILKFQFLNSIKNYCLVIVYYLALHDEK